MKTIILYGNCLGFFYCCYYKINKNKRQDKRKRKTLSHLPVMSRKSQHWSLRELVQCIHVRLYKCCAGRTGWICVPT